MTNPRLLIPLCLLNLCSRKGQITSLFVLIQPHDGAWYNSHGADSDSRGIFFPHNKIAWIKCSKDTGRAEITSVLIFPTPQHATTFGLQQSTIPQVNIKTNQCLNHGRQEELGLMLAAWEQRSSTGHQTDSIHIEVSSVKILIIHQCINKAAMLTRAFV